MNNAMGKNNQLLTLLVKIWIFYFAAQILAPTKNDLICWLICMPGPTPHYSTQESKYTAIVSADAIFCISIYRFIKCTAKSQYENDVKLFP